MTADLLAALVPLVVLTPLVGAATSLALGRRLRAQRVVTVIALTLTTVLSAVLLVGVDAVGTVVVEVGGWQAPFGIVLVVDRLSALLLVVSSIVLLAVLLFSVGQNIAFGDDETPVTIYNPGYLILATGVYTAFIAGDLFNLYVGFEILLVASYVLITLGGTEARIRTGTTYIVVSLVSSALFLSSIAMIYGALGTVNLAHIALRMDEIDPDVRLVLHVMLLLGFGIKAAVFPLSFWLPDSYPTAPAPVTAVFAGLLTKVGVYAIIRTETLLFPAPELNGALLVVAALTMVVGVLGAVAQTDIKRLLSFTLVSHIGYLILGIGLGTVDGMSATIYYVVHHIVVQTALFLAAGLIEQVGGSTAVPKLGGLLAAAQELGDDAAVDCHGEGFADARVVERLTERGKAVILAAKLGHVLEARRLGEARFFQNRDAVVVDEVELPLLVHRQGGGQLVDHEHLDVFDRRFAGEEIRVGLELDLVLVLPGSEQKGAVGDDVLWIGPFRAEFLDHVLTLRVSDLEGRDREKIGSRMLQPHLER